MKSYKFVVYGIAVLAVAAIVFGVLDAIWSSHAKKFDPFVDTLMATGGCERGVAYMNPSIDIYTYRDWANGYTYQIEMPKYLSLTSTGYIDVMTDIEVDYVGDQMVNLTPVKLDFTYHPGEKLLVLNIAEMPVFSGESSHILGSAVDGNGQPIGRSDKDSEEFYSQWLALHDKWNEPIMEMLGDIKEMFGEDVFADVKAER